MLIPTLELLTVSFILGVLITGVVLVGLWAVETAARFRHRGSATVDQLRLRPAGARASDHSRAA